MQKDSVYLDIENNFLYENFAIWEGLLNNIGKKFEKDLRVIFDNLHSSWNSQPETQFWKDSNVFCLLIWLCYHLVL